MLSGMLCDFWGVLHRAMSLIHWSDSVTPFLRTLTTQISLCLCPHPGWRTHHAAYPLDASGEHHVQEIHNRE